MMYALAEADQPCMHVPTDRVDTERQQREPKLPTLRHKLNQSDILQPAAQSEELHGT